MKLPLIILLIFLSSCNHLLVPNWYTTKDHNLPTEKVENEWVSIYVENLEARKDLLVFDVEVVNQSRHPLNFKSSGIYYYASDEPFEDLERLDSRWEERSSSRKFRPLSPEDAGKYYHSKIQGKKLASGLTFLASIGMAVYGATGGQGWMDSNSVRSVRNQAWRDLAWGAGMFGLSVADQELNKSRQRLEEDLYYLSDEILVDTWIPAEKSVRGKVLFERDKQYRFYRMMVPIEDETFVYDFKVASSMETSLIKSIRRSKGY